jgi:hypothetical protein
MILALAFTAPSQQATTARESEKHVIQQHTQPTAIDKDDVIDRLPTVGALYLDCGLYKHYPACMR